MKKANIFTRLLSLMLVLCMVGSLATIGLAATWDDAIIDTDATCSVKIHKIDWTNAIKDGVWNDSYVSTGLEDDQVEALLTDGVRKGDLNNSKDHPIDGGSGKSNGYAIEGVQFSYLRVADIATFTESANDQHPDYNLTQVLYGFNKTKAADLLVAIGLGNGSGSYANATATDKLDQNNWWYTSDSLNAALAAALKADATGVKDALETYIIANRGEDKAVGGVMPFTDENGESSVNGLKVGLYLFIETLVPEMVTSTTNPFFLSLPMTNVNGGGGKTSTSVTDGGHEWLYNINLYPKNETGLVTLEKTSREAKADSGKNNASTVITDGFSHNTTASAGDTLEYQIISTLPTITSQATAISAYTFVDTLSKGLTYDAGSVKLEWFTDAECATDPIATWTEEDATAMFEAAINAGENRMTISMTAAGLAAINGSAATAGNVNNGIAGYDPAAGDQYTKYAGYSNYTVRVTYTAKIDSDASFVYGDAGNKNEVVLTWKRTSSQYYDTIVDDAHVYSYAMDLTKLFSDKTQAEAYADGSADKNMYEHVKFKLKNVTEANGIYEEGYYVIAKLNPAEGVWYVTGHTADVDQATILKPAVIKDSDGKDVYGHIVVKGLEDDTYELTEVETANGYTLLKDRITMTITVEETESYCDVYENEVKKGVYQNDGHYNYEGCPSIPLAGIPQQAMAHHTLTASATVDTNAVTMNNDTVPSTGASTESANALVPLTVMNTRGIDLPQTGDFGTLLTSIGGPAIFAVCTVGLFLVFFLPKRKKEDEQAQQ